MSSEICLISSIYPPESGGPARFTSEFAKWLSARGFKVTVITYSSQRLESNQSNIKLVGVKNQGNLFGRYLRMSWAILRNSRKAKMILVAGAFIEFSFVNFFDKKGFIAKIPGDIVWERARNNKVTNLGILDFQNSRLSWKYSIFRFLFHRSIKESRLVLAPSNFIMRLVYFWGVPEKNIRIIYNSVPLSTLQMPETVPKTYDVLTVARLVPWKGIAELIEVCSDLDLNLCVVGTGPDLQHLQDVANRTKAKVSFLGKIHPDEMHKIYSMSEVFVLNSSYEGLPHVLIEARRAGLLTVAKAGTGSDEVINDGTDGLLVGEGSGRTLEDALRWTLLNPQKCEEFKIKALKDLSIRFNQNHNFELILDLLRKTSSHD